MKQKRNGKEYCSRPRRLGERVWLGRSLQNSEKRRLHGCSRSESDHFAGGDVTATKRAIANLNGPVILVGHSYGGAVITEAGSDPKVVGLVYVAAFAPDAGESVSTLIKGPGARCSGATDSAATGWISVPR